MKKFVTVLTLATLVASSALAQWSDKPARYSAGDTIGRSTAARPAPLARTDPTSLRKFKIATIAPTSVLGVSA